MNPVLREGNSDRRAPASVKAVRPQAPALDGRLVARLQDPRRHHGRATTSARTSGRSRWPRPGTLRIELRRRRRHHHRAAATAVAVDAGEVVDATVMRRRRAPARSSREQIADAKAQGVLFSLHLKATMMKVSDPIMFGHAVRAFFPTVFAEHGAALEAAGISPNDGLGALLDGARRAARPTSRAAIEAGIEAGLAEGPAHRDGRLRQGHHEPPRARAT